MDLRIDPRFNRVRNSSAFSTHAPNLVLSVIDPNKWAFSIVNATSQLYFSEKACRNHLNLGFLTVLGLLSVISITGGVASSIAMGLCVLLLPVAYLKVNDQLFILFYSWLYLIVVRLGRTSSHHGMSATERLFRAYLVTSTVSGGLISFLLVGSYQEQRQQIKMESLRNAAV